MRPRKIILSPEAYLEGILRSDRVILSQAITLVESMRTEHRAIAEQIIAACLPYSGRSFRIGITGTPGVGKSTFIEAFGSCVTKAGHQLAVLAIDPSSQITRGSILGDKTRMEQLGANKQVYIRPSPAGTSLGGVAQRTRETVILCEAAGYDVVVIETVGVGQSEVAVHSMTDFFLLLLLPGAGDELQGIKRGIVEMADLIAVNKCDGEREQWAKQAQQTYKNALHLLPPKESAWAATAVACSALTGMGISDIWKMMQGYHKQTVNNNYFVERRAIQSKYWLHESLMHTLREQFYASAQVQAALPNIEKLVLEGKLSPFAGATALLKTIN